MIWNIAGTLLLLLNQVQGHGHMIEPKSRNYRAWREGAEWSNNANVPKKEYTPQGLNNAKGQSWSQCGIPQDTPAQGYTRNYDSPLAANGQPLSWKSQATYQQGSTITIKLALTVPHNNWNPGYFEFYACPRNQALTEACFKQNRLTFVQDKLYGENRAFATTKAPGQWPFDGFNANDPKYPFYYNYEYLVKLPSGLSGDVLIQWVWTNTNSGGISTVDPSGVEKFWNCAEVTISGGGPAPSAPVPRPSPPTGGSGGTCGNGNRGNGSCANGQCCSQLGWCGTSSAHCNGSGTVAKLGDWALCSSSSQCSNGCCSGTYSGGTLKCTPLGQGFNFWANGCVSRRRLGGNETLVGN